MKKLALFLAILLVLALTAVAQEEKPAPEQKYTNDSIARLSFIGGKTFVQRASDLGYEEAVVNTPITEGDRIGTTEGRAEIRFGRSNAIRLDEATKIDILNLPKKGDDTTRLRIWSGRVFLDIASLEREKSIEVHTADASFYILDEGIYRLDVLEDRKTSIAVWRGAVEAAGETGSTVVKSEQRLEITEGRFAGDAARFMAVADDSFDRWNETRTSLLTRQLAKRYLPDEIAEYEEELDSYGDWQYLAPYGYVWAPRGMAGDWRPYWYGRWAWLPLTGWTWIPYEPWGWAPFHYGRWHWGVGMGWYWIPSSFWGPAWVNWWWDDYYFGWAPMSWWGYPGVVYGGRYYGRGWDGYYPWDSRALIVVRRDQLRDPKIHDVALREDSLKSLTRMNLTSQKLDVRPVGSKLSVQPLDGKRVILREGGDLSRYRQGASEADRSKTSGAGEKSERVKPESLSRGKSGEGTQAKPQQGGSPDAKKSGAPERRIRKKDGEPAPSLSSRASNLGYASRSGLTSRSSGQRSVMGYPSSPAITRRDAGLGRSSGRSESYLNRFYRYYSGGNSSSRSSSRSSSSGSRISSGSGSRGVSGRTSSGSASRGGSSGGSRGGSGGPSGGVRKK